MRKPNKGKRDNRETRELETSSGQVEAKGVQSACWHRELASEPACWAAPSASRARTVHKEPHQKSREQRAAPHYESGVGRGALSASVVEIPAHRAAA